MTGPVQPGPRIHVIQHAGASARPVLWATVATAAGILIGAVFFVTAAVDAAFGGGDIFQAFGVWLLGWLAGAIGMAGTWRRAAWAPWGLLAGAFLQIMGAGLAAMVASPAAGLFFGLPAVALIAAFGSGYAAAGPSDLTEQR